MNTSFFPWGPLWPDLEISSENLHVAAVPDEFGGRRKCSHPLYEVSRRNQFVEDVSQSLTRGMDKQAALFSAASRGDVKSFIQIIVDFPREVNLLGIEDSKDGYYLTHRLAESGAYKGWRFLLNILSEKERGALLSKKADNMDTCLIIASHKQTTSGHLNIMKSILSDKYRKYCDINDTGAGKRSALYRSCQAGHIAAIRLLLKQPGIILNNISENGHTPYGVAAFYNVAEGILSFSLPFACAFFTPFLTVST